MPNYFCDTKPKLFLLAVFAFGLGFSVQGRLNGHKCIIAPKKFNALAKENQYQTSTLAKHLFAKNGFVAVYGGALPDDLANQRCWGLRAGLPGSPSWSTARAKVVLTNCRSKIVFKTGEGKSKKKEARDACAEALTGAFQAFKAINYPYAPQRENQGPLILNFKGGVQSVGGDHKPRAAGRQATLENQSYKSWVPSPSCFTHKQAPFLGALHAQAVENGFNTLFTLNLPNQNAPFSFILQNKTQT